MYKLLLTAMLLLCAASANSEEEISLPMDSNIPWEESANVARTASLFTAPLSARDKNINEFDPQSLRVTYSVGKDARGTTLAIPEFVIAILCGDGDGCELRLGMHDWDSSGRVASRSALLYYNTVNRAWRSSHGDWAGRDDDGVTTHIMQAWSCYLTDGEYANWANLADGSVGFGLLSWSQYIAECQITIVD